MAEGRGERVRERVVLDEDVDVECDVYRGFK